MAVMFVAEDTLRPSHCGNRCHDSLCKSNKTLADVFAIWEGRRIFLGSPLASVCDPSSGTRAKGTTWLVARCISAKVILALRRRRFPKCPGGRPFPHRARCPSVEASLPRSRRRGGVGEQTCEAIDVVEVLRR